MLVSNTQFCFSFAPPSKNLQSLPAHPLFPFKIQDYVPTLWPIRPHVDCDLTHHSFWPPPPHPITFNWPEASFPYPNQPFSPHPTSNIRNLSIPKQYPRKIFRHGRLSLGQPWPPSPSHNFFLVTWSTPVLCYRLQKCCFDVNSSGYLRFTSL